MYPCKRNSKIETGVAAVNDAIEKKFDKLVEEAVLSLPEEFAARLDNVSIMVKEFPGTEAQGRIRPTPGLLGLYHGVPYGRKSVWTRRVQPDMIFIYKQNILRICSTGQEIVEKVREVVIHEIGHHFGLSDKDME